MTISDFILLRMKNISDKIVEKIKTHFVCSLFFPENHGLYEVTWYSHTGYRWHYSTARALCVPDNQGNNTDIHSEYVILIAFPQQQWLR